MTVQLAAEVVPRHRAVFNACSTSTQIVFWNRCRLPSFTAQKLLVTKRQRLSRKLCSVSFAGVLDVGFCFKWACRNLDQAEVFMSDALSTNHSTART